MEPEKFFISEEQAQMADLLEQIDKVNAMIILHRDAEESSMLEQYQYIRFQFVDELQNLLQSSFAPYQLTVHVEPKAA